MTGAHCKHLTLRFSDNSASSACFTVACSFMTASCTFTCSSSCREDRAPYVYHPQTQVIACLMLRRWNLPGLQKKVCTIRTVLRILVKGWQVVVAGMFAMHGGMCVGTCSMRAKLAARSVSRRAFFSRCGCCAAPDNCDGRAVAVRVGASCLAACVVDQ